VKRSIKRLTGGVVFPAAILLLWWLGSDQNIWNAYVIPAPCKVIKALKDMAMDGSLIRHMGASFFRVFTGFAISVITAVPMGFLMGLSSRSRRWFDPTLDFLRHVPPLAVMPMLILWFGIGEISKIVVVVMATFFPILLNTQEGVVSCDESLLEVGRVFRMSRRRRFREILVPSALPSILVGMRLGLGYSWRSLIGAELIAASSGIGYMIHDAEQLSRSDVIVTGVILMGVIGSLSDWGFLKLSSKLVPWKENASNEM
jgi:sulfonate transport system permease protein